MSSGFKCRKCYVVVENQSALVAHYAVAHCRSSCMIPPDHGSLVCPHCDDRYASAEWLSEHVRDAHGVDAARDNQTSSAAAANDDEMTFTCCFCKKEFASQALLEKHIARMHESDVTFGPQCDVCNRSFRFKGDLTRHRKIVHGIGYDGHVFLCQLCSRTFKQKYNLKAHLKSRHKVVS